MSAVPVFIPPVFIPPVSMPPVASPQPRMHLAPVPEVARSEVAQSVPTPIGWQLTDRGIVVVLLVAAMILTAAIIAIGVTAVRVTSADYDANLHGSSQTQR